MIGRLCGRIVLEEPDGSLVLDVHGVGYDVMAPLGTARRAGATADAEGLVLCIHTHVREDSIELYGFATETERRVFRLLIAVPNVGPKTALGVLSALPSDELAGAVRDGDLARLGRVPGIGKKTAERLVLELKGKLPEAARGSTAQRLGAEGRDNAARLQGALTNMGYRAAEAEQAVKALGGRVNSEADSELLREALAWLTR